MVGESPRANQHQIDSTGRKTALAARSNVGPASDPRHMTCALRRIGNVDPNVDLGSTFRVERPPKKEAAHAENPSLLATGKTNEINGCMQVNRPMP